MAFPTTSVLDPFTRANVGPPPSASWATGWDNAAGGGLRVVSNQCVADLSGSGSAYWTASTFGPDCEVYATIAASPSSEFALLLRLQTPGSAAVDGYFIDVVGGIFVDVFQVTNDGFTALGSSIPIVLTAGDSVGASMVGSTITVYQKTGGVWSTLDTRTDPTYAGGGNIGLLLATAALQTDDFGGGTVVISDEPETLIVQQSGLRW